MGIGELSALTAAALWAASSLFWSSFRLAAWEMNLCKSLLGAAMVLLHLMVVAHWYDLPVFHAEIRAWVLLGFSGLVGLAIGDTFFFRSLQILGPRRALMLATTSPIFVAALGWTLLGERLLSLTIVGILVAIFGVVIVLSDRKASLEQPNLMPGTLSSGIFTGTMASLCQAIGIVFSKWAMRGSDGEALCDPMEATFIRLLLSGIMILAVVLLRSKLVSMLTVIRSEKIFWRLMAGTALGTWLGIGASMIAISHTDAAVAQTLMATCPLFAIPILWIVKKQPATLIAICGTIISILGVGLVVYR